MRKAGYIANGLGGCEDEGVFRELDCWGELEFNMYGEVEMMLLEVWRYTNPFSDANVRLYVDVLVDIRMSHRTTCAF